MQTQQSRGLGPWYCAMARNLNVPEATEIFTHGSAYLYVHARNLQDPKDQWVTIMTAGPFYKWDQAHHFSKLWARQHSARAKTQSTVQRGLALLRHYRHQEHLQLWMWIQSESPDALREQTKCMRVLLKPRKAKRVNKQDRLNQLLTCFEPRENAHGANTKTTMATIYGIDKAYST